MLTTKSEVDVPGMSGRQVTDFLMSCDGPRYRRWWPGTHLDMRVRRAGPDGVGSVVYMDERIGHRRVKLTGVVTDLVPGRRLLWQLRWIVRLPFKLSLELEDRAAGLHIVHTISAGFGGVGRVLDPLLRVYFTRDFAAAMDAHVREEFPRLRDLVVEEAPPPPRRASGRPRRRRAVA